MSKKSLYLIAYYYLRPGSRVNTSSKGWMSNDKNFIYDEKVTISSKLTKNDLSMAKIILDLENKTLVRNGWSDGKTFDQVFEYFHQGYPSYTNEIMGKLDPEYLEKFKTDASDQVTEVVDSPSTTISS